MSEQLANAKRFIREANRYRRVFEEGEGRKVLDDLMRRFYIGDTTLGATPQETAANEGARRVVLHILNQMGLARDPEQFLKPFLEAENDDEAL